MPKESRGDSLDKAAGDISNIEDSSLASKFVEANEEALDKDSVPFRELFYEEEKTFEYLAHTPDPEFLKEIDESLSRKEIHHKKLLEETAPTNFFLRIIAKLKTFFHIEIKDKNVYLTPESWKLFSMFCESSKKETTEYLSDFGSLVDLYLRGNKKTTIFKLETIFMFAMLCFIIPCLVLFPVSSGSNFSEKWKNFIFSSSIVALCFLMIPAFFFASLWFVNVNHLLASKNFHFFIFASFTLAFLFTSISFFNLILFYSLSNRFSFT